ncbi:MAG: glycosyltransferase family 2 protein [Pseudolabrys sp.]|nr:glycosyltransferase family 2 protein [Pseudolabrys sp.]
MLQAARGPALSFTITIIVATYERPDALDAVLRGLSRQTDRDFEVVVADDGSGPATAAVVDSWKPKLGAPLIHVWHPHEKFRLAEIRNRGIAAGHGEYFVFLDGDCIPRPNFVAQHRALAERGWFVTGNRVLFSEKLTREILDQGLTPEIWDFATLRKHQRAGGINRIRSLLSLPLGPLRKWKAKNWKTVRGCNLGIWREDLVRVDGFDSNFRGWGLEDSDMAVRLMRGGCRRKEGRFATGVLHLWHPFQDRSSLTENQKRLDELAAASRVRAVSGLSALKPAG